MKKIIDKIKKFGIIETIVISIYIIIVLLIAINHECYEDEAQSWLIARDLNFIEIIQQMKYEGHSFLWYFIIAPFAKLGFPVGVQNYISCCFAIITVYLILKKSPFNRMLKILLTFSSGMIYFYSVIARPYCMIPFFLVCIAILYKDRRKHPYIYATLIGLLAQTHLVMIPTSIMLMITFWGDELLLKRKMQSKEDKAKLIKSLLICIMGILIYIIIMLQALGNCEIVNNFNNIGSMSKIETVFNTIKNTSISTISYIYGENEVPLYYKMLIGLCTILCIIGSKNNLKQASIFWSQLIFTILVHSFFWFILATRVFIVLYTLMFWLWIDKEEQQGNINYKDNKYIELAIIILILISNPSAYKLAYQDITNQFSTGKITANYIKENIPEGACFICTNQELQQSVIAYLEKDSYKFYMPNQEKFITYITWDKEWNSGIDKKQIATSIEKLKKEYENLYIISAFPTPTENNKELFNTDKQIINSIYVRREVYYIYEI